MDCQLKLLYLFVLRDDYQVTDCWYDPFPRKAGYKIRLERLPRNSNLGTDRIRPDIVRDFHYILLREQCLKT